MGTSFFNQVCVSKVEEILETKLYVGNMSYATDEEQLRTLFSEAGTVVAVDVIKDRDSGRPKGFAFITMSSKEEATKAIQMYNEKEVDGRALTVNEARPREERSGGFRPRTGGGGYNSNRGGGNRGGGSGNRSGGNRGGGGYNSQR
jgi:RNA recognition motif-containing protein